MPSDGPKTVTVTEPQGSINDLKEGDTLTLKCSVKESNPPANQFTWYKNSQVLRHTSEILTIINVSVEDRGSYHCKANNGIKAAESNKITVSVKCKYCYFHFTNTIFMFLMKYLLNIKSISKPEVLNSSPRIFSMSLFVNTPDSDNQLVRSALDA